jgi:hypothetical protein
MVTTRMAPSRMQGCARFRASSTGGESHHRDEEAKECGQRHDEPSEAHSVTSAGMGTGRQAVRIGRECRGV